MRGCGRWSVAECKADGCDRPVRLAGLCGAHHARLLRHGDVRAHIPLRGRDQPSGLLWCSACETSKPPEDFYRNRTTRTGYDGVCKACVTARRTAKRAHRAVVAKAWRERNRDAILARKRQDYQQNRERSIAAGREWRRRNPDRSRLLIRAQNAARYARLKSAPGHATAQQIAARWAYYGDRCWMCRAPATDTDHVKPLAVGGSNWPANLRPACRSCNRSKSASWPYAVPA